MRIVELLTACGRRVAYSTIDQQGIVIAVAAVVVAVVVDVVVAVNDSCWRRLVLRFPC